MQLRRARKNYRVRAGGARPFAIKLVEDAMSDGNKSDNGLKRRDLLLSGG